MGSPIIAAGRIIERRDLDAECISDPTSAAFTPLSRRGTGSGTMLASSENLFTIFESAPRDVPGTARGCTH